MMAAGIGPEVRGWCPGALRPMRSGDGLVVRVRPRLAEIGLRQARGIADLAIRHGNGFVQLTNRANLQIRGIADGALPDLTDGLAELGLLDDSPEAESRRNIVVNPFWHLPADGSDHGTGGIADGLAARLSDPAAPALPGKFGFAVDATFRIRHLADVSADIRIETGRDRLIVRADGAALGREAASPDAAVDLAMAMASWFVASGGVGPDGRGRMRDHLGRGAAMPPDLIGDTEPSPAALPHSIGPCGGGVCVGFALGQIPAENLRWIAERMRLPIRVTPWRSLFLRVAGPTDIPVWGCDIITSPRDPQLRVTACTGAPGCPQALGDTRGLARELARHVPEGSHLHVSGCTKGCAHPGPAAMTLVATRDGYDLIRPGRASDLPDRTGIPGPALASLLGGADAACV